MTSKGGGWATWIAERPAMRCLVYGFLALAVTAPLASQLSTRLLGHPDVDLWNHIWGFWWVKTTLLEAQRLPLSTDLLGYPRGGLLYFIDPLNALLSIPLQLVFGLVIAYNLTLLAELALAGLAAHLLAREAGASESGGYLAGLLVITSPILRAEIHNGITEVGNLGWLALSLLWTHRALHRQRHRDAAMAGLMMALAFIACWYYGMAAGLAAGLMWLLKVSWHPPYWPRIRKNLTKYLLCLGGAGLIAAPFWSAFTWTLKGPRAFIKRAPGQDGFLVRHNATDLLSFFIPGDYHRPDLWADYGERFLHTTYLGWGALLLGLYGLKDRRSRPWAWIGIFFAILCLGPYLYVDGRFFTIAGKYIRMPFFVIFDGLGLVAITHPGRMVVVTLLCLGVTLALGYDRLAAHMPRHATLLFPGVAGLIGLELLFWGPAPWPMSLADAEEGPCSQRLADDPLPGAVLDLPGGYLNTMRTSRYLFAQTQHRRPIPYVVHVRPEAAYGLTFDHFYGWLLEIATRQDRSVIDTIEALPTETLKKAFRAQFEIAGYRYVVIHRDIQQPPWGNWPYKQLLDRTLGPPESTSDGCWIYQIPKEGP